ncbi:acyl-CoA dehydrogenase family member 10 isoform X2 [Tachysurus ichikawai]
MMELRHGVSWFLRFKPPFHRHVCVCSSSSPRAVIFDMFGVLIPSPIPKATEWENENGIPAGTIGQAIKTGGNNNSWSKYMRGELGPEEFVEAFSRDCSQIAGFKVHVGPLHSVLTGGSMSQPVTVMIDAVQHARAEGFKTAVLSNNFLMPGGKSYLPLNTSLFDVIVESCRVGLCKPDLRIYQLCAERLGVSPHEAVFLDNLSFNVEAAVQLGMHGITQFKANEIQPIPAMDRLIDWLLLHLPKHQKTTLLHGNFSLNNLVFGSENPDVRAVLGWSLSTVGDPLVDVATCCMSHFLPATASTQSGKRRFFAMMGIPSAEEIFDLYRKEMGLEYIPNWQFYMAFCFFRQAAILQTNYKTSLKGTRNTNKVEDIAQLAWDFATKEGFRVFNALP